MKKAFRKLDLDNSGGLSLKELKSAFDAGGLVKRSNSYWENIMKSMDLDKDN